ncbi:hypothetical protein BC936DRAFT_150097 [Jimgerdemannia flammicorona]|uniref:Uncharacterized protein n=1 Tax=Jimgerdemannia flammicorona TaxID=994334 RepID=A0A433DJK6_9FUNG|nr:hypothetical protein BC936DRAFT_150097 [Jimgerdemannia flammicorona]
MGKKASQLKGSFKASIFLRDRRLEEPWIANQNETTIKARIDSEIRILAMSEKLEEQLESRNSKRNRHGTENGANDEDDFDSKRRMVNQNGYSLRNRKNVDYFEDLSSEDPIEEGIEDNIEAAISETSSLDIEDLENSKHTGKEEERWNEMKEITAVDDAMSISICLPQEEDADVEKASESAKEANEQESLQLKIGTSGPHVLRQARRMLFTFAGMSPTPRTFQHYPLRYWYFSLEVYAKEPLCILTKVLSWTRPELRRTRGVYHEYSSTGTLYTSRLNP